MFDSANAFSHLVDHEAAAKAQAEREARPRRGEMTLTLSPTLAAIGVKIAEMDKTPDSPMVKSLRYMRGNGGVNADGSVRTPNNEFWMFLNEQLSEIEGLQDLIWIEGVTATASVDKLAVKRELLAEAFADGDLTEKQYQRQLAKLNATATQAATAAPAVTTDLTADLG